jgi:hypothetical protein
MRKLSSNLLLTAGKLAIQWCGRIARSKALNIGILSIGCCQKNTKNYGNNERRQFEVTMELLTKPKYTGQPQAG